MERENSKSIKAISLKLTSILIGIMLQSCIVFGSSSFTTSYQIRPKMLKSNKHSNLSFVMTHERDLVISGGMGMGMM